MQTTIEDRQRFLKKFFKIAEMKMKLRGLTSEQLPIPSEDFPLIAAGEKDVPFSLMFELDGVLEINALTNELLDIYEIGYLRGKSMVALGHVSTVDRTNAIYAFVKQLDPVKRGEVQSSFGSYSYNGHRMYSIRLNLD